MFTFGNVQVNWMNLMIAQNREDGNVVEGNGDNTRDRVNVTQINGLCSVPHIMGHIVSGPVDGRDVRMTGSYLLE